eukprot:9486089-Pyramimonas_sp.AAC.1
MAVAPERAHRFRLLEGGKWQCLQCSRLVRVAARLSLAKRELCPGWGGAISKGRARLNVKALVHGD